MFFNLFSDTQQQMQELLLETRTFVGLQKKALIVETRDKLSVVLSRLAIAVVCLILGGIILLFFSFFLAYIIGQSIDNIALGFACVTAFDLLLLLLFWFMREAWVIKSVSSCAKAAPRCRKASTSSSIPMARRTAARYLRPAAGSVAALPFMKVCAWV